MSFSLFMGLDGKRSAGLGWHLISWSSVAGTITMFVLSIALRDPEDVYGYGAFIGFMFPGIGVSLIGSLVIFAGWWWDKCPLWLVIPPAILSIGPILFMMLVASGMRS